MLQVFLFGGDEDIVNVAHATGWIAQDSVHHPPKCGLCVSEAETPIVESKITQRRGDAGFRDGFWVHWYLVVSLQKVQLVTNIGFV